MGGTSTDVALIRNAQPSVSNEIEIEYAMPIHVPMVDVRTVGAGGGSIARVNSAGLLEVGPESAGASPGPICYGNGGTQPTISDANLVLKRLDPGKLKSIESGVSVGVRDGNFRTELGVPLQLERRRSGGCGDQGRKHENGRRDPNGVDFAGSRPARFFVVCIWRCRSAARLGAGARTRYSAGSWCRAAPA